MSNSLAAVHPELIVEWSDRNLPLTPDSVTFGSNKKVWWKGACGHEWETSVKARSNGEKCPICSGARVIEGINDLSTLKPKLASEWSEKNEIKPTEVSIGSHKKVIWKCKLGHEWTATVKSRTINRTGCPYCSHNKVLAGFNDLATVFPDVAAEWSDRNEKKPTEVTAFANSKAWWKCKTCGYEWNTLISTRSYGSKCPCCSGYVLVKGRNDLKTTHPNIAEEWSKQNFPLQPDEVNAKSRKNVWWHCKKCGNEWKSVINARVKGTVCPVCAERAVLAGYNDLATTDSDLLSEWDYELNNLKPTEVSRNSAKRAWWKCRYGHSWSMKIVERTPVPFDVTEENSTQEGGITLIKVDKPNMAQKGTISVEKTGEVFFGVNVFGEKDKDVIYQPVYTVKGLAGAVYEITADEDIITPDGTLRYHKGDVVDTVTTDDEGFAKSKELYLGKYTVVEIKAPNGMVINNEKHSVELTYAGQDVAVTETVTSFYNERQKVKISLEKVLEQNDTFGIGTNDEIKNISFGLYAKEDIVSSSGTVIPAEGLIEIITLDENGTAIANTDLPFGSYYIKEIATDEHYILSDTQYPFTFEYAGQDTEIVEIKVNDGKPIENKLIYGSVSGKKIDENGEALGGALIGIFKADESEFTKEHAIMTATSEKDGSFSFAKVPYGQWIVREIEAPTGFVLDDTSYEVNISKNEQVIEVEIANEYIHGNIQLTKVDADYPDNKLTGATFEVYRDVNGDGKLDDGDELIGNLKETSTGIYEMKELLYGKYLVRETKAPDGFELDKGVYSVFIENDETTYNVENKAGVGFINQAMKGNLKIKKTSSDGKVEGFTFRVTGENGYDRSFTTDKNGEIFIEGLRIGEYTVSEVGDSVSAGYVLPADKKASVKVGSTTVVEMHNVLRDTPKTGDNSKVGLWTVLAGLSALGIAGTVFAALRKKKKEDDE